jgi:hypothetical protein
MIDAPVKRKLKLPKALDAVAKTLPPAEPCPPPAKNLGRVPLDFVPATEADLELCLSDPFWRVCSGWLYKIMVKSNDEDDDEGELLPFKPNRAQRRLMSRLWHRNVILKARQLGFTTLIAIMWLDHALFNKNQRCGIIAQDREAAEVIFRDKVKLAYENLPEELQRAMPLARKSATEILFAHNNSSVRVATSMRSGTIHRLHISEFGKICAKYPEKAKEVILGSIPAVPLDGITVIESTAEGQDGDYYKITNRAMAHADSGKVLTQRDYRFHFFPWWQEPSYRIDSGDVVLTDDDNLYFAGVEASLDIKLDLGQRRWYVATRDEDFSGEPEKMWQEYPSTPLEAFQVSTEGTYFAIQLRQARKDKRIGFFPHVDGVPVNTFWDIGGSDGTAIWFHQRIGAEDRMIDFEEAWDQPYSYFGRKMQERGYLWGRHYLPHDAGHKRQKKDVMSAPIDELEALKVGGKWEIVPRVDDVNHGIQLTRKQFSTLTFNEATCKAGLVHLGAYRKTWNEKMGIWMDEPRHDEHSEAADALRQMGQGYTPPGRASTRKVKRANGRTA